MAPVAPRAEWAQPNGYLAQMAPPSTPRGRAPFSTPRSNRDDSGLPELVHRNARPVRSPVGATAASFTTFFRLGAPPRSASAVRPRLATTENRGKSDLCPAHTPSAMDQLCYSPSFRSRVVVASGTRPSKPPESGSRREGGRSVPDGIRIPSSSPGVGHQNYVGNQHFSR